MSLVSIAPPRSPSYKSFALAPPRAYAEDAAAKLSQRDDDFSSWLAGRQQAAAAPRKKNLAERMASYPTLAPIPLSHVDFLSWHAARQEAKLPEVGRMPAHLKKKPNKMRKIESCPEMTPASDMPIIHSQPLPGMGITASSWTLKPMTLGSTAASNLGHTFSGSCSWSGKGDDGSWAGQTSLSGSQSPVRGRRVQKKVPANERKEKQWSSKVFETLPRCARSRNPASPLARLTMTASLPQLVEDPRESVDEVSSPSHPRLESKASVYELDIADSRLPSLGQADRGRRGVGFDLPPGQQTSADQAPKKKALEGRGKTIRDKRRLATAYTNQSRPKAPRPCDIADMAHKWGLPLSSVHEAASVFKEWAALPGLMENEDMIRDGVLREGRMFALVSHLSDKSCRDALSATTKEIMGIIDANNDGSIDFQEFAAWYNERAFLEYVNLTPDEIKVRRVGHRLGISAADMDFYKAQFDKFDTDGSGDIDVEEFGHMMNILMKVPKGLEVPESRIKLFWQDCDTDGTGEVCLQEFVEFYVKHFNIEAQNPMVDFYKNIRRVPVFRRPGKDLK